MEPEKNYEFDSSQNETIFTLAKSLQFVGAVTLLLAILFVLGMLRAFSESDWGDAISHGMSVAFTLAMGSLTYKAGREFQAIVATSGKDISHLMTALENLRKVYSVLSWIIILFALLLTVVLIASIVFPIGPALA